MEMDHLGADVAFGYLFDILGLLPSRGELEAPFSCDSGSIGPYFGAAADEMECTDQLRKHSLPPHLPPA